MQWIQIEQHDRVAHVIMKRVEKRNALNPQLVGELSESFQKLNQDRSVKIIVLKSQKGAFSAGADLAYIQDLAGFTHEENKEDSTRLKNLFELIYNSPKVTISQVEGPALAGGCGLATITDFCFATTQATFGYTEARIGFVPALVMVYLKEKLNMNQLSEWLLTSHIFGPEKAKEDGLVYAIKEPSEIDQSVASFASKMVNSVSAQSVSLTKEMLRGLPFNRGEALQYAAEKNAEARRSDDCIKGIAAFLNKEKISW